MLRITQQSVAAAAVLALGVLAFTPTMAQMPPDIAEKIAAIGRVSDPAKTAPIYAPLHDKEPYGGVRVSRDLRYGPHERQILDLFAADAAGSARPVLMFVHGGGFIRGNKRPPGSPFYDNVMLWAARNGMVGVNVEYRLAPQFKWPSGADDLGLAVRWVAENVTSHGGDPNRIFLMGHSAGATHVASYVAHPQFHGPKGSGLAGAMLSSGAYDLTKVEESEGRAAYFGSDRALYGERSALPGLLKASIPFMLNAAELDPPWMVDQLNQLRAATCESPRGCVRSIVLPKHSHMSEAYAIGTADRQLTDQLLEFIKAGK